MWKKVLGGLIIAIFLGVSYSQFQNVNIYNAPSTIYNRRGHFKAQLTDLPAKVPIDFSRILLKPKVKKVYDQQSNDTFLQVTIPYVLSSHFKDPIAKYTENVSNVIRVGAGGTVWLANPHRSVTITPKHPIARGAVTVDLFIQNGYPEKALRHFKVYFLDRINENQTLLYHVS